MSIAPLILVIDDELQIQRALRKILAENGCRVMTAATGEEGLALAAATPPDAVILDLGLPDMDGAEVCEKLRAWTQTPILILSARDDQRQKVIALDKGADDYLTKPFGIEELMARVRVALRHGARISRTIDPIIVSGSLVIDLARRQVTRDGVEVADSGPRARAFRPATRAPCQAPQTPRARARAARAPRATVRWHSLKRTHLP